jgi:Protein of unknown function (DUF4197)
MRKISKYFLIGAILTSTIACDTLETVAGGITGGGTGKPVAAALTNGEVISGLKEALTVGITNSVNLTSITDGFLKNAEIKLPFPPDALKVRQKALDLGLDAQVEKFELTLNRAAEEATKEAMPIFKNAILGMSVTDGFAILNGGQGAATKFLKDNTTAKLTEAFAPKVANAISQVKLTEYWNPLINKYNQAMTLTGGTKLNPDLNAFVTERAILGLFTMVTKEENKIRLDPLARVSDLLSKVFGSIKP